MNILLVSLETKYTWYIALDILCQDDSELDAGEEEVEKRSQNSAQIGLNYASLEPGAEVEGNTFGPEYK